MAEIITVAWSADALRRAIDTASTVLRTGQADDAERIDTGALTWMDLAALRDAAQAALDHSCPERDRYRADVERLESTIANIKKLMQRRCTNLAAARDRYRAERDDARERLADLEGVDWRAYRHLLRTDATETVLESAERVVRERDAAESSRRDWAVEADRLQQVVDRLEQREVDLARRLNDAYARYNELALALLGERDEGGDTDARHARLLDAARALAEFPASVARLLPAPARTVLEPDALSDHVLGARRGELLAEPAPWEPKPGDLVTGKARDAYGREPVGRYVGTVDGVARIDTTERARREFPAVLSATAYVDHATLRPLDEREVAAARDALNDGLF